MWKAGNSPIRSYLWITLPREEIDSVTYRRRFVSARPFEGQRLGDVLGGLDHPIRQENANIRIAGARGPAGVLQRDSSGEPLHYDEEVRIHHRLAGVGDGIAIRLGRALAAGADPLNASLGGHVQEFKALVAPRQGVV